ncbi:nicotinamide riboside transporter PnuC [Amycolatopsis sp. NPDC059657]|uniref:nicotinamide riboside transporter PnuC n=1 Tax=Amycolatopsis sp. NPDC059657 TaxID=3346899 RepID=UPI00367169D2
MFALLVSWFNAEAFRIFGAPVSVIELIGAVTGVWCVWLVARQNLWNWPIGIANNLAFLLLFTTAGLYADAGLQVVYVALALYGWWNWLFGGKDRGTLPVRLTRSGEWIGLAAGGVAGTVGLWALLAHATDSTVPWWDAATTVLSLLATYGQTRKLLESWWFWIAADVLYIPLYGYKGLWVTAVVYVIFLCLCVNGLISWRRALAKEPVAA